MRHSISSCISLAFEIINSKVILEKLFCSADLPETQAFGIHKLAEIFMIDKDKYFKFATF